MLIASVESIIFVINAWAPYPTSSHRGQKSQSRGESLTRIPSFGLVYRSLPILFWVVLSIRACLFGGLKTPVHGPIIFFYLSFSPLITFKNLPQNPKRIGSKLFQEYPIGFGFDTAKIQTL